MVFNIYFLFVLFFFSVENVSSFFYHIFSFYNFLIIFKAEITYENAAVMIVYYIIWMKYNNHLYCVHKIFVISYYIQYIFI